MHVISHPVLLYKKCPYRNALEAFQTLFLPVCAFPYLSVLEPSLVRARGKRRCPRRQGVDAGREAAAGEEVVVLAGVEGGAGKTTGEVAAGRRRPRFETKKLERPRLDRMRIGE